MARIRLSRRTVAGVQLARINTGEYEWLNDKQALYFWFHQAYGNPAAGWILEVFDAINAHSPHLDDGSEFPVHHTEAATLRELVEVARKQTRETFGL